MLVFTANSAGSYQLSGGYSVTDAGVPGSAFIFAQLLDTTANEVLFENEQVSAATPNQQFVLGGTDGDTHVLIGRLTGTLIKDHIYQLTAGEAIQATEPDDMGASALGNITLTIDTAATVPEPLSLMVWVGLILGAGIVAHHGKFSES